MISALNRELYMQHPNLFQARVMTETVRRATADYRLGEYELASPSVREAAAAVAKSCALVLELMDEGRTH